MKKHFEDFDLTDFWKHGILSREYYTEAYPSEELIASIEEELGYKLPAAYIELMQHCNGGVPKNNCFPTSEPTCWADDHVQITGILGIGRTKLYSLCGELGSTFFTGEGQYPKIGICICDTPTAGDDMIMLDYTKCGKDGEPEVVHVDDGDSITFLAKDFETFIRGLVHESVSDTSDQDLRLAFYKVEHGSFSSVLVELCNNFKHLPDIKEIIRNICIEIVTEKGYFALHADELSRLMYDTQFWLYSNSKMISDMQQFLSDYEGIMTLTTDGEFTTNGYAPDFVTDWLADRMEKELIVTTISGLDFSARYKQTLTDKLLNFANRRTEREFE
jgi:hypothetical protein